MLKLGKLVGSVAWWSDRGQGAALGGCGARISAGQHPGWSRFTVPACDGGDVYPFCYRAARPPERSCPGRLPCAGRFWSVLLTPNASSDIPNIRMRHCCRAARPPARSCPGRRLCGGRCWSASWTRTARCRLTPGARSSREFRFTYQNLKLLFRDEERGAFPPGSSS